MGFMKDILFVSYLKNKGVRRICFVIGAMFGGIVLANWISSSYSKIENFWYVVFWFYLPFMVAAAIRWMRQGFTDSVTVSGKRFSELWSGYETIYTPGIEGDIAAGEKIHHVFMKKFHDNGKYVFLVVFFNEKRELDIIDTVDVDSDYVNGIFSSLIPGTIYLNGEKYIEEEKNEARQQKKARKNTK